MYIELRKVGFQNKGSELMLHAMMQQLRSRAPGAKLVMAPSRDFGSAPYAKRSQVGLYQKAWLWQNGFQLGDCAAIAPARVREMYGVVLDKEIDIVLDAAGFSYSDQWGSKPAEELSKAASRWKANKTKVILLPQAFGPFTSTKTKEAVKSFVDNVDLIFAREQTSYENLVELVGNRPNVRVAPDFTNLVKGIVPANSNVEENGVCIIPNYRMVDKTGEKTSSSYLSFLKEVTQKLANADAKPFFLIHETTSDLQLAKQVISEVGQIPIWEESDPVKIKGIIGASRATVGSRFHGLVSALSQGVPSLATGWSHKYELLFKDYGFEEGVVDLDGDASAIDSKLDFLLDPNKSAELSLKLKSRAEDLKQRSTEMWDEVFLELGL